jgi:hypothetical protein
VGGKAAHTGGYEDEEEEEEEEGMDQLSRAVRTVPVRPLPLHDLSLRERRARLAAALPGMGRMPGRGLHSSTSQLMPSRFLHTIHPEQPLVPHYTS